jgi:hypothetical protein
MIAKSIKKFQPFLSPGNWKTELASARKVSE